MMFHKAECIHFIGIGGVGMSGIAELLIVSGFKVCGSDISESQTIQKLRKAGAHVFIGHRKENVVSPDVVVISSAVAKDNPEIIRAKELGIPVIPRAEMLAELMRLKKGIAVAGTHGKTTTTSILGNIMNSAGWDPTTVVGGKFLNIGSNARFGKGEYFVCEADESDGSFMKLSPIVSIVTNIDNDHMDYYGNEDNLRATFTAFMNEVPFYGFSVLCGDDPNIRKVLKNVNKNHVTYGLGNHNDFMAKNIKPETTGMGYDLFFKGKKISRFSIPRFGMHSVLNSMAAVIVCLKLEMKVSEIRKGLSSFKGVGRRMELTGTAGGVTVFDDYAHHPTELKTTIEAFKLVPAKRRIGIFQPHRYTRTQLLADQFSKAFGGLDELVITEIYAASEKPIKGVTAKMIADNVKNVKKVFYIADKSQIASKMAGHLAKGDLVITFGAGDIYKMGTELLHLLKKTR